MKTRFLICTLVLMLALITPLFIAAQEEEELYCPAFPDSSDEVRTGYYMGEGAAFFRSSQLTNAIHSYRCVIEQIDSDYLPAYMQRAAVYAARREYDLAIADYTRAIELDGPKHGPVVGDRQGRHVELTGAGHQLFDTAQAIQQRVFRVHVEMNEGHAATFYLGRQKRRLVKY